MLRNRRPRQTEDGRCARHGTPTQLRCARCGDAICPRCLTQTPVGFMCADHTGAPVKRAADLPLTSRSRPFGARSPQRSSFPIGLLLLPAMFLLTPVLTALTGGGMLGVLLVPALVILVIYGVARRRR